LFVILCSDIGVRFGSFYCFLLLISDSRSKSRKHSKKRKKEKHRKVQKKHTFIPILPHFEGFLQKNWSYLFFILNQKGKKEKRHKRKKEKKAKGGEDGSGPVQISKVAKIF